MSELPGPTGGSTSAAATRSTAPVPVTQQKPYWLYRFAAWVVIVAGIVFVVATIFFAGAYIGQGGWHRHHGHSMGHRQPPGWPDAAVVPPDDPGGHGLEGQPSPVSPPR